MKYLYLTRKNLYEAIILSLGYFSGWALAVFLFDTHWNLVFCLEFWIGWLGTRFLNRIRISYEKELAFLRRCMLTQEKRINRLSTSVHFQEEINKNMTEVLDNVIKRINDAIDRSQNQPKAD
jgi:hypothetical protein